MASGIYPPWWKKTLGITLGAATCLAVKDVAAPEKSSEIELIASTTMEVCIKANRLPRVPIRNSEIIELS